LSVVEPWQVEGVPWKTESAYWGWVRGVLRAGSSRNPVKIEYTRRNRIRVPNPNPNGRNAEVWGMQCATCKGLFSMPIGQATRKRIEKATGVPLYTIEINHKSEAGTLKNKRDLGEFATRLLYINFDDLEPQCQNCHRIISYSQRHNISFEEAEIEKRVIAIIKEGDREWLKTRVGYLVGSNAKIRRQQITEIVRSEYYDRG